MLKQMIAVRRRPGFTHQECLDYVEHIHGDLARAIPVGPLRYVQSHVFDAAFGAKTTAEYQQVFGRDFVTELFFESAEAMQAVGESEYVLNVMRPDERMFNDFPSVVLGTMSEIEVPVPHAGPAAVKVIHYLKKADESMADAAFQKCLTTAHATVLARLPQVAAALRRYVLSCPILSIGTEAKYFGLSFGGVYEVVASMWFEDEAGLKEFRAYEQALMQLAGGDEGFIDFAQSFFLYTHEKVITG